MPLMSSTQPISTTRCPANGSRPVVSVSSTISRMPTLRGGPFGPPARPMCRRRAAAIPHESPSPSRIFMHKPQNVAYLRASIVELLRAIHDKVGAPAFLGIRHLLGEKRGELVLGHPRAAEDALALQLGRRRHHDDGVAAPLASGLEQERHV